MNLQQIQNEFDKQSKDKRDRKGSRIDKVKIVSLDSGDRAQHPYLKIGDIVIVKESDANCSHCQLANGLIHTFDNSQLEFIEKKTEPAPKWTLEKIKNCDEIKFGTIIGLSDSNAKSIYITTSNDGSMQVLSEAIGIRHWNEFEMVRFYRPDGSEILPPEDKVEIKPIEQIDLYQRVKKLEDQVNFLINKKDSTQERF
jgi:hypothetical protein